jgi:hypothetical protein
LEPILLEAATPSIHEHYNRLVLFNYPFFLLVIIELSFFKPLPVSDNTYDFSFCTSKIQTSIIQTVKAEGPALDVLCWQREEIAMYWGHRRKRIARIEL